jgi:hypothetical protein
MRARFALVLVLLVTTASLSTMFAEATHQDRKDGNDVKGKLDIRSVNTFGQTRNPGWKIITFSRSTARALRDRGFFLIYFDTFDDERFDYYALISSTGSTLKGKLWRDRSNRPDRKIGKLSTWRTNKSSASVRVPLNKMNLGGQARLTYRWFVKTLFTGKRCHRVCIDRVPNEKSVTEENGKLSPSPTDTDDPGLTESPEPTATPDDAESPSPSPWVTPTPDDAESPSPSPWVTPTP